jgi:hypothetical protein
MVNITNSTFLELIVSSQVLDLTSNPTSTTHYGSPLCTELAGEISGPPHVLSGGGHLSPNSAIQFIPQLLVSAERSYGEPRFASPHFHTGNSSRTGSGLLLLFSCL